VTFEPVANNLRESFRVVAAAREGGELRELPGVSIASAGVTFQMFNCAFLSAEVPNEAELGRRLAIGSVHFKARGQKWSYWVCEDWMEERVRKGSRALFEGHGLKQSTSLPGMVAHRLAPPVKPLPRMEVRRVADLATRSAFCDIGSVCFNVPMNWFREVFGNAAVWERFTSYVGYVDEEPVCTASVVAGGGAVGVYNVATLPGSRRRGYGEGVMRHALEEARREHRDALLVLQSTPAGLRLYERMGFRTVTRVSVYSS
jgi:ribosomal protein S18 acetylase RimI-like enzyme